ncbi:MAG: lipopolysaccharide transport periplasmic protein LptA [Gammaproteobacteria bacterium]
MSNNRILNLVRGGLLPLAICAHTAAALENDSEQPIYIDSDSATYDESKGVSTYSGKVVSKQGSMQVTSDELVVYTKDGEVTQLIWTGNPVHLKQTPKKGKEDITGESRQAEYYPDQSLLVLMKKATVWQGDMTYKSDLIKYDLQNNMVKAGEKSGDNKRVHVEMKPKGKK